MRPIFGNFIGGGSYRRKPPPIQVCMILSHLDEFEDAGRLLETLHGGGGSRLPDTPSRSAHLNLLIFYPLTKVQFSESKNCLYLDFSIAPFSFGINYRFRLCLL